jgi:CheY-like chemotaxis protein
MSSNHVDFDGDRGPHQSFERPEPSLNGLRVLVIENNALVREAMECLLTAWGCQITLADGALMACDKVRQDQAPDIILSDYQLNDGYNGINAIRLVRELTDSKIPACLISADSDGNLWHHAEAAGAYFLRKPVPPTKVLSMLSSLLLLNGGDD